MTAFWDITPFSWEGVLLCATCGWLLGIERQLRESPLEYAQPFSLCWVRMCLCVSPFHFLIIHLTTQGYWVKSSQALAF